MKEEPQSKKTILIVDDETEICMLLAGIIRRKKMNPLYVHTIADAKNILKDVQPQLLFLDINLPDGNGIDLLSELNKHHSPMRVVVISAFDSYREKAYEYGAYSFLSKPFSQESVVDILSQTA